MLEERWAIIKWITNYIDIKDEKWAKDAEERTANNNKVARRLGKDVQIAKNQRDKGTAGFDNNPAPSSLIPQKSINQCPPSSTFRSQPGSKEPELGKTPTTCIPTNMPSKRESTSQQAR